MFTRNRRKTNEKIAWKKFGKLCFKSSKLAMTMRKRPIIAWKVMAQLITRCFKKFHSGSKNLDIQVGSGWPKSVNSEVVTQPIEANPVSSTLRVSGELGISQSSMVDHSQELGIWKFGLSLSRRRDLTALCNLSALQARQKSSGRTVPHVTKILQIFLFSLVYIHVFNCWYAEKRFVYLIICLHLWW